ncbi:non-homologous end-joining factor 1 [Orussus abietinus]|uniref:non-homologous end-joining factor 1 n=1 Tax=Orussus abietinus TaxID=222816 RepID=UPI0006263E0F|nr:non-homologous end-joining factor 1 [Orussus abietinus]
MTHMNFGSKWKEIELRDGKFLISVREENKTWRILLTDLVEIWSEVLEQKTLLARCRDLNPLLGVDSSCMEKIIERILDDIPKHSTSQSSVERIILHTIIEGGVFRFNIDLTKGTAREFWREVTMPMYQITAELDRRQKILLDLVKRKDEEIAEYVATGAELIRKHIKTQVFHSDLFKTESPICTTKDSLNIFQSVISSYNEIKAETVPLNDDKELLMNSSRTIKSEEPLLPIKVEDCASQLTDVSEKSTASTATSSLDASVHNSSVTTKKNNPSPKGLAKTSTSNPLCLSNSVTKLPKKRKTLFDLIS